MRVGEDVCADVVGWEGDGRRGREWKGVLDGGMVGGEMGDTDAGEYEDDFDEEEGAYEDDFEEADEEFEGGGADEGLAALPEAGIAPRAVGADDDEEFQRFLVADEGASSSGLSLAEQIKAERLSRKEALSNQIQASMGRAGYVKSDERALPPRAQVLAGADVERPGSRHGARVGRGSSPGIGDEPAGDDGVSERRAMGVVPEARVRPPAPAEDEETLEAFLDGKAEILTREERRERIMQEADHAGNNGLLTEVEVYTEPPCNWVDGETLITCLTSAALAARGVRLLAIAGCLISNQFALQVARGMRGGSWMRLRLPRRRS